MTWAEDFIRAEAAKMRQRAAEITARADQMSEEETRLRQQVTQLNARADQLEALLPPA